MRILRILGVLSLAATVVLLPACGRSNKIQVGFVTNNAADFWTIAEAGARKAGQDFDVEVIFKRGDATSAGQKEIVDSLLAQQVAALSVSPIDPIQQVNYFNRVADKVPLFFHDNDAPGAKRLVYIGTDNYEAGKEVGKLVKQALPDGGVLAIFVGQSQALNAQQRRQGLLDELAGEKDAKGERSGKYLAFGKKYLLYSTNPDFGPATDDGKENVAQENAMNYLLELKSAPRICLIGLWAYNPPAILKAYRVAKQQGELKNTTVKIVGFDENEATLSGIKSGDIVGTVVQNPFEFSYLAVKLMAQVARGDKSGIPASGVIPIAFRRVTQANVEEFHDSLKKQLGK